MTSGGRIRVKICGITSKQDARFAVDAGADALGFVFDFPSPRNISPEKAAEIMFALPPFVSTVGVFADPEPELVARVLSLAPLASLQFHGHEPAQFCASWGRPYLKALRPDSGEGATDAALYPDAAAILVDACKPGSGVSFDWSLAPQIRQPLILAGGLHADNLAAAVRAVRPYGVDVSSGVESSPGVKSQERLCAFVCAARACETGQGAGTFSGTQRG